MGSRRRILFLLFPLLIILCCGGLYIWIFRPPLQISELSLPQEHFPAGAEYQVIHQTSELFPAVDNGIQTIYWSQGAGLATFNIERLPTLGLTRKAYNAYANVGSYPLFQTELYQSAFADDFVTGCGEDPYFWGFRCHYTAMYREYVVALNVIIDEKMSIDDFNAIVRHVDQTFQDRMTN